jgi:hypothetical protein
MAALAAIGHLVVFGVITRRFAAFDVPAEGALILLASIVSARIYDRSIGARSE